MIRFLGMIGFVLWSSICIAEGFTAASPERALSFPEDFGAHPTFQTEWWYMTGHLVEKGTEVFEGPTKYGFQITFFRRAERIRAANVVTQSYLAHAALTDIAAKEFLHDERLAPGGAELAGAQQGYLHVWNRNWKLEQIGETIVVEYSLKPDIEVRLIGTPDRPPLLHGAAGFSKKGTCDTCASHYYSRPGILVSGEIRRAGVRKEVHGLAWLDHEFMSNALSEQQVGWDWVSLLCPDGKQLMAFQLRNKDGTADFQSATLVTRNSPAGTILSGAKMSPIRFWESPATSARYPVAWRIEPLPKEPGTFVPLSIEALVNNQELQTSKGSDIVYWEGAVRDSKRNCLGYLEMTGYANKLSRNF